ncbi:MAG: cupin domain-containing protein [Psychroserpens sp.]|nr:cupin domain-containing protein [Psychroserpens sp.]
MVEDITSIIKSLDLQPHPEGGYFKETYRSDGRINVDSLGPSYSGSRNYSTCIYFLLTSENFSAFHRIKQDEIWHFYKGSPIVLHTISSEGIYHKQLIGSNFENDEVPQYVVKGGDWFAAEVLDADSYSLVGCTVAPGFSFEDFEMADRSDLTKDFPEHRDIIEKLTIS